MARKLPSVLPETHRRGARGIDLLAAASRCFATVSFWTLLATLTPAAAQVSQAASDADGPRSAGAPESDILQPLNLFQLAPEYRIGNGEPADVTTYQLRLRMDHKIPLDQGWTLGLRSDIRLRDKNPINEANPDGAFIQGFGDVDVQAALSRRIDERWWAGAGVRLYAPTGGEQFGTGKWQIMPGAAVRYALPEISETSYVEPLIRYAQSFAGDPSRRTISNLQFAPTINIGLPDRWYFVLYPNPDIRVNFGDPITGQTGRLFLPLDVKIGRKISDQLSVSLEAGVPIVNAYPVYNFKSVLYIDVRY